MRIRVKGSDEPGGPEHGWGQVRNRPEVDPATGGIRYGIERVYSGQELVWHAAPERVPPWCEVLDEAPAKGNAGAPAPAPLAPGDGFPPNVRHLGGPWYEIKSGNLTEKVMGKKAALARAAELRLGPVEAS